MQEIDPRLGTVNHDYPPFLDNDFIKRVMYDFAEMSGTTSFYLVGGTVVDTLFYPENPLNDLDINFFSDEEQEKAIDTLSQSGILSPVSVIRRNTTSTGNHYRFTPHNKSFNPYEITFIDGPKFVGQYSPECPLIQYSTGLLVEQGPFLHAHKNKTIDFIRPIEFENKQDLLIRFIHVSCKYDLALNSYNFKTFSDLRQAFDHRSALEFNLYNTDWLDTKLLSKAQKASTRRNNCWTQIKDSLRELRFDEVLSKEIWQKIMQL